MAEYAVRYDDFLVCDTSWLCIADVIATYHGTDWSTPQGQVTGELMRRESPSDPWMPV